MYSVPWANSCKRISLLEVPKRSCSLKSCSVTSERFFKSLQKCTPKDPAPESGLTTTGQVFHLEAASRHSSVQWHFRLLSEGMPAYRSFCCISYLLRRTTLVDGPLPQRLSLSVRKSVHGTQSSLPLTMAIGLSALTVVSSVSSSLSFSGSITRQPFFFQNSMVKSWRLLGRFAITNSNTRLMSLACQESAKRTLPKDMERKRKNSRLLLHQLVECLVQHDSLHCRVPLERFALATGKKESRSSKLSHVGRSRIVHNDLPLWKSEMNSDNKRDLLWIRFSSRSVMVQSQSIPIIQSWTFLLPHKSSKV